MFYPLLVFLAFIHAHAVNNFIYQHKLNQACCENVYKCEEKKQEGVESRSFFQFT